MPKINGDDSVKIETKEMYIAYLDVLGFSEIVNKKDNQMLTDYYNQLFKAITIIEDRKKEIQFVVISDSTILVTEPDTDNLKSLLMAIQRLQAWLVYSNIWVRGAVTLGQVYYNKEKSLVVGPGLIKAFNLEKNANYPRVIIDPILIPHVAANRKEFITKFNFNGESESVRKIIHTFSKNDIIEKDLFFVSYLNYVAMESEGDDQKIEGIYQQVKDSLYGKFEHHQKYFWIKNYFTEVFFELFYHENISEPKSHFFKKWATRFNDL
jgi:hypothetical protein